MTMPWATGLLTLLLAACTPELDWREVRPAGTAVLALMPCKPASHARRVTLAGAEVEMTLHACRAADATWAIAHADLADPARVTSALDELAQAAQRNVGAATATAQPSAVPGMTPNPSARRWRIEGRLADGRAVVETVVLFAHGTRVVQASVIAERADAAAPATFVESLRVKP
ncbi:MAG TPA: hypothetical protein VFQ20_01720 [Burkholderiaceae bacterium]|nr:hypothetical protein [Burkholderiaceae bacterium]